MAWLVDVLKRSMRSRADRAAVRKAAFGLSCPLGDLADFSAAGMRVWCQGVERPHLSPGDTQTFALSNGKTRLFIEGAVVWVEPRSSGGYYMGVRWTDQRPGLPEALEEFARTAAVHDPVRDIPVPPAGEEKPGDKGPGPGVPVSARVEVEDLYAILGVEQGADQATIAAAFRNRARELHPDINRAPDAEQQMARLNKAYSVLRDAELRRRYDALVASTRRAA